MNEERTPSRWLPATLIFLAVLSTAVASLGTPLLPAVQNEYGVTLGNSQWTLTITLLVGAVVVPIMGRLGAGAAHKSTTVVAVVGMLVGCVLSALPWGFALFLLGRAVQGVGLGLVPLATATARADLREEDRAKVMATIGVTTAAGIGIGYPVVGLLAQLGGVALPFWAVAVLSALCLGAVVKFVPHTSGVRSRVGAVSSILLGIGLTLILLVLSEGESWGWNAGRTLLLGAVGIVSLAAWAWWELRVPHPLIDLRLLRNRAVVAANASVFLIAIGFYPLAPLVVRLVQTPSGSAGYGFDASVVVAGLMLTPFSLASFVGSRAVHSLSRRWSAETIVAVSCLFPLASFVLFWSARTHYVELVLAMTLSGLGVGFVYAVNPLQIARGTPVSETSSAMSTYQLVRTIAYSIGSALSATLLIVGSEHSSPYPAASGYSVAALFGIAALVVALVVSVWFSMTRESVDTVAADSADR